MGKLHDLYGHHEQSPWLDNLKRGWITGGELEKWVQRGVRYDMQISVSATQSRERATMTALANSAIRSGPR